MTLLSSLATTIATACNNLAQRFASFPAPADERDNPSLPDADRKERELRILMSHWF